MMSSCSQCGSSVPENQSICSMCYGDISYGNDGHYEQWAREQERKQESEQQAERESK